MRETGRGGNGGACGVTEAKLRRRQLRSWVPGRSLRPAARRFTLGYGLGIKQPGAGEGFHAERGPCAGGGGVPLVCGFRD